MITRRTTEFDILTPLSKPLYKLKWTRICKAPSVVIAETGPDARLSNPLQAVLRWPRNAIGMGHSSRNW